MLNWVGWCGYPPLGLGEEPVVSTGVWNLRGPRHDTGQGPAHPTRKHPRGTVSEMNCPKTIQKTISFDDFEWNWRFQWIDFVSGYWTLETHAMKDFCFRTIWKCVLDFGLDLRATLFSRPFKTDQLLFACKTICKDNAETYETLVMIRVFHPTSGT